jgi:hypothetical protein
VWLIGERAGHRQDRDLPGQFRWAIVTAIARKRAPAPLLAERTFGLTVSAWLPKARLEVGWTVNRERVDE